MLHISTDQLNIAPRQEYKVDIRIRPNLLVKP